MANVSPVCEKKADPAQCSPEQIRECHGDSGEHPCAVTDECEGAPDPSRCSQAQVRMCHGDSTAHSCE